MLVSSICAKNKTAAFNQIKKALLHPIDAIELRLDYFSQLKIDDIKNLKQSFKIPMVFTLRKKSQGGLFKGTEKERLKIIENLFEIAPEYFDLESDVNRSFINSIHQQHPKTKLICSYHDFKKTPKDLDKLLKSMMNPEFSIYKIATFARSTVDSLRMLNFVKAKNKLLNICGLCMGELGQLTRILSPIVNNALNYVALSKKQTTAPGQLDLDTLFNIYYYKTINQKTKIYALLGDPVEQSIGHVFHNNMFKKLKQNAVYIKLLLKKHELSTFFKEAAKLPFKGFSVTMPLKECIIPFVKLSLDAKKINAVNTLLANKNKLIGFNTDGIGALNAIEKITKIKNKKIVVLGAGGTAKAIIDEAIRRGAKVLVLNRTLSRAKKIAETFDCEAHDLTYAKHLAEENYDILINATSAGMENQKNISLLPAKSIIPETIILDMVYKPKLTKLLKAAKTKNCLCITGEEAFINQAILQEHLWGRYKSTSTTGCAKIRYK